MKLLLDVGNTSLRWVELRDGRLGEVRAVRHFGGVPIDLHADWDDLDPPDQIILASVAGEDLTASVARVCQSRWGLTPMSVRVSDGVFGVTVAYEDPSRLGVDRWLALIGAHADFPGDTLILDAGTAVTFDRLRADGRHLGGLILPGRELMRDSLSRGTRIPRGAPTTGAPGPWATDTGAAIDNGIRLAPAALAIYLLRAFADEIGPAPQLLVTGGDAETLLPLLPATARWVPDLVFRGIRRLA
ncbi:type III pantothenate kinase [Thioalkalicoccus limnaeus]|uniref:Type III pantothenate kinase n=1 Tax=Thioalkalicoccus limnaeus TaxID=120681 RepID=A0ABV4BCY8_9GAMM